MAVHKSTQVTNFTARPVVKSGPEYGGHLEGYVATLEATTAMLDNADDVIRMITLPSTFRPLSIKLMADDLDSDGSPALTFNVGLYYSASDTAAETDIFATAITEAQAVITAAQLKNGGLDVLYEAYDYANVGKMLWEIAGLTTDPQQTLDVVLDVGTAAATAQAGTITMIVIGVN